MSKNPADLQQLENENKMLREQLAQAQKMTALGELVGTTTHEFNNVLMTILNYAKLGLRNKDEASRDKALNKILAAGERAAKITHNVLGMAKNRGCDFEPTCLKTIITDSLFLLEKEMQKYRIALEVELGEVPEVRAIGNQIQQILVNLLINARQAIVEHGRITIRLEERKDEKMVAMIVRDFGPGMAPEKLRKIFDPYFTTKEGPDETGRGGTGLGLSACKDIVEAHQGKIRVESSVGKGTCFTIMLPIAESTAEVQTPHLKFGQAISFPPANANQ